MSLGQEVHDQGQGSSGLRNFAESRLQLHAWHLPAWDSSPGRTDLPSALVVGRNAAGKDGQERLGGSVLEQIPFLQNCEDEDSDEDDELDSVQHKKQRVKVGPPCCPAARPALLTAEVPVRAFV